MQSFLHFSFLLVSLLLGFSTLIQAQSLPSRTTTFRPTTQGQFQPSVETKTTYNEQGRRTYLLEFCWNEDDQKVLQRELWIEYENEGELSFTRVDVYDKVGSLVENHFNWFDDQRRPTKDSTWNLADTINPIVVFRYSYELNEAGQSLKEIKDIWLSSEPEWALNKQIIYTYDENGCIKKRTICYSNKYETNCYGTEYQRNLDCTLIRETSPFGTQTLHTANTDSSERNLLTLQWLSPTQEWIATSYKTTYYDQWGQNIGHITTNLPDSSQSELIYRQDSLGNLIYSRSGARQKDGPWLYYIEYELIEDSETYKAYRRFSQWDIDAQDWYKRSWYTTEKDTANGIWRYQELDSVLINGVWTEFVFRSRRFHNYYCNGLLQRYEDYLGWDDLSQPLEMRTYAYQVKDIPCQGTPSPERLILYPNPTTDFLTFRSPDILQMTGVAWQVVDLSGRVIQKGVFQQDDQACVDVRRFATGHYILYVGDKADSESYRFVKQ